MIKKLLKHPLVILAGVAAGVVIGVFNAPISASLGVKNFAKAIEFPGQLYLFFLQMTVIPIIITAIASSLGKLMRNKSSAGLIKKIVVIFVICMLACAFIGIIIGAVGRPGSGLDENTRDMLSGLLSKEQDSGILEMTLSSADDTVFSQRPGMAYFFSNLIPANIFQALSLGSVMAILFFSIIFGIAIGFLPETSANLLINLCTAIFQAFQKLIIWSLYLLPFGLICLLAGQIAAVGVQIFIAMSKFITLYCVGTIIIFVICTIIIWIRSGIFNPLKALSIVFEPILLAFATRNSMACLPSAINCLDNKMDFNSTSVNLTLPLGMTLGRFGNIFYFALAVFFIGQIYNIPFTPIHYLIILVGVIFAGTATAGASGIVTLTMMSIVLEPLNLPMEAVLIIFMAIDPIIDPFRSFLIVYVNMAATTLVAGRGEDDNELSAIEAAIENAEQRIQRSFRAKLSGTATENDEQAFNEISEEITRLREQKKLLLQKAGSGSDQKTANQLIVFIQEAKNRPPLLTRRNGQLEGYEILLLEEIGKRMNKQVVFLDCSTVSPQEERKIKKEADIIAGVVTRGESPPFGFYFSDPWGTVNTAEGKKSAAFLLSEESGKSQQVNKTVKLLNMENFLKTIVRKNV